jgi:hypothetical protein
VARRLIAPRVRSPGRRLLLRQEEVRHGRLFLSHDQY